MIVMCWWQLLFLLPLEVSRQQVHDAVMSLCLFFNAIEQKDWWRKTIGLREEAFWDPMPSWSYLPTIILWSHAAFNSTRLAREIWYLVPSYLYQMFPYARFFGFLKSLVRNRLFPKGAIVRGYETVEAVPWTWVIWTPPKKPHWCASFTAWR
jgi:hypothetical protein